MGLKTWWDFARPHTIIGTVLAVVILYAVAGLDTVGLDAAARPDLRPLALTFAASLCLNIYVVGLNQLTDITIDRINKPFLPLASGALTPAQARIAVGVSGLLALLIAGAVNSILLVTIAAIMGIGTAYSLPPLRFKRFSTGAGLSIMLARGVLATGGVYLSYRHEFGAAATLPPHMLAFMLFMAAFTLVIAIMKDVPDMEGDRRHAISTLAIRMGAERVLMLCRLTLALCYLMMIALALWGGVGLSPAFTVAAHSVVLAAFLLKPWNQAGDIYPYYMFIWRLFYLEFFLFFGGVALAADSAGAGV